MGRLVHYGLGSSSLVAHVLPIPLPPRQHCSNKHAHERCCPSSKIGLLKQVKNMPVRATALMSSCCFEKIHSSAKQLCEERSLFSQTSTHWVSLSNSVIISCQHRQISPPNSNNVSAQRSIKSFTCAMDSLPNRMRYSSSVISQLSFRNCCSCMAHALSRYAAVDLFNQGKWEDLWKLANKAGERAKARAAKNPRRGKPKSDERVCVVYWYSI